ncbi:protein-glutamate methylesterase/protein-glutamine glutaminase [Paracoccus aerodenitrificans]|uniref:protein-glutamate methylesterase/protein-glutamine glutaminase n=1 Tax=Paracoccus aerodenitrificans TaxID=3017781 RepID=UPI0022F069AD|nr:chemotaxis response regulator protein-glutamate methylesterase [Paracoccus aerodenitrificans]WBU65479.1 chemotaxis response regulator protein-glutamate methylesterase [Paracoccus aerodenitrificans]
MKPVRVLIVDDSSTMRHLIGFRLRSDPRIEIVGEASNAEEARRAVNTLSPDVLTLDVEMPGKSGLEFLAELMRLNPMPVIMISSETQKGSAAAVEALSRGAVDCVGKPRSGELSDAFKALPALVVAASTAKVRGGAGAPTGPTASALRNFVWNNKIILIGSSTGGVDALETIISNLPENCPPILITQHMPPGFLSSFAQRMDSRYAPKIAVAEENALVEQGLVMIAPGGSHHLTISSGTRTKCKLVESPKVCGHRPSVDMLFNSAIPIAERIVATLLTGMGNDGAHGILRLRKAGARCFAQDEESSVVWGMPRIAWMNGGAEKLVPLRAMAPELLAATERGVSAVRRSA